MELNSIHSSPVNIAGLREMTDDPHTVALTQINLLGKYQAPPIHSGSFTSRLESCRAGGELEGQCQCYCCWGPPWLGERTPSGGDWLYPTELHSSCVWGLHQPTPGEDTALSSHHCTLHLQHSSYHGSPWFTMVYYGHLSSPQFTLNKQQLADCWATESCELGTLLPVHGSNSIRNAFPTVQPVKDAHWLSEANQTSFCFSVTESSLRNVKWTVTNWSITETNQWCAGVWPEDGRSWVTSRRNLIWDETRIGPNKLQDVSQNYLDNVLSHNLIRAETR